MLGKLLPILLAVVGLGGGVGAGLFLRPAPAADDHAAEADHAAPEEEGNADADDGEHAEAEEGTPEYVKLNNQFVVPVVEKGRVAALVVLSLSLEVEPGSTEAVYVREPKLRDVFLQVMFDHANTGGFSGSFTDGSNLIGLRTSLKEAAAQVLGLVVTDVLITDIARQDS
ncbi:flagellar basal body-associated FliL family protein [Tabrizicola sp.]|uniref:flagellar basal body-associated FliL family protein n=1 Tax=Tabrizicola sp. TaxID=2005166 RepID=UPI0035B2AEEB